MLATILRRGRGMLGRINSILGTSSAPTATAYSNQRKLDRCQNGNVWSLHWGGSTTLEFRCSLDNGKTIFSVSNFTFVGTNGSYTPNASMFITPDDYMHVVYKDRHNGYIYYRRGTPNAARTGYTWSAAQLVESANGCNYPDLVVTGNDVHIVYGRNWSIYNSTSTTEYEWKTNFGMAYGGASNCVADSHYHGDSWTGWGSYSSSPWGSSPSYEHRHMVYTYYEGDTSMCNGWPSTHSHYGSTPQKTGNTRTVNTGGYYSYYAYIYYRKITIGTGGALSVGGSVPIGGNYGTTNSLLCPSIDFHHIGDSKTVKNGLPHLFVAWSSGSSLRFRKASFSAGTWAWEPERNIDPARYILNPLYWLVCLYDGVRVVIVGQLREGATADLMMYDRDLADTYTITRILLSNNTDSPLSMYAGSATYDDEGNVYILGRSHGEASGYNNLVLRPWDRGVGSLLPLLILDEAVGDPYVSAKRGASEDRVELLYTDGTGSPYNIRFEGMDV